MRKIHKIVLSAFVTVVALELILQASSLLVWWLSPPVGGPLQIDRDERVILCVGDSFTQGVGASDRGNSYPARLQTILDEKYKGTYRVVNHGIAGQNSREALERLGPALERYNPVLVYVMVGANDSWSRPRHLAPSELEEASEQAHSYRWRWRIPRLIAWATRERNGAVRRKPEPSPRHEEVDRRMKAFRSHRRGGEITKTVEELRRLDGELDDRDDVDVYLIEEIALYNLGIGERRRCLEITREYVDIHPESPLLWSLLAWESFLDGDMETAVPAIEKAYELVDTAKPEWKAFILERHGGILLETDKATALKSFLVSYRLHRDMRRLRGRLVVDIDRFSEEEFGRVLNEINPTPDLREELWTFYFTTVSGPETPERRRNKGAARRELPTAHGESRSSRGAPMGTRDVYESHLRQMVELGQSRGATVVIITYPNFMLSSELGGVPRKVARDMRVDLLDLLEDFEKHPRGGEGEEYFVSDGHCNDAGYRLVAELVAEDVARRRDGD